MDTLRSIRDDFSISSAAAGVIAALVGLTTSAILVFRAAIAGGVTPADASSWLGSLCVAMGILSVVLSLKYRSPVLIAWSTAGSALLITGLPDFPLPQAIGAFLFSAALILLSGATGLFERLMGKIPVAMAAGLLGGVLLHFTLDAFAAFKTQPVLIGTMVASYVAGRRFFPRLTMIAVLGAGIAVAAGLGLFRFGEVGFAWTRFTFTAPSFAWRAVISLGVPLFIVTMASQNLTGIAVMRANGYSTPVSPLMAWTGGVNLLIAPFGGFSLNLAAITAAIAMGPESHPLPRKRYIAGISSGLFYVFVGLGAGAITSLFAAFPAEMISAIAGLALLSTVASCLQTALAGEADRESAFLTFAVSASGVSALGIGSAFWGLVVGAIVHLLLRKRTDRDQKP